jgi:hypothetical protein
MENYCSIDSCNTTYGSCSTYAGAGCTSGGGCKYTSCNILANGKKQCTWQCNPVSLMVPCDPQVYCSSCTTIRGSRCASGSCTWSSCCIDYSIGIPTCNHICTAAPVNLISTHHCSVFAEIVSPNIAIFRSYQQYMHVPKRLYSCMVL